MCKGEIDARSASATVDATMARVSSESHTAVAGALAEERVKTWRGKMSARLRQGASGGSYTDWTGWTRADRGREKVNKRLMLPDAPDAFRWRNSTQSDAEAPRHVGMDVIGQRDSTNASR